MKAQKPKIRQPKLARELDVTDWRVHGLKFSPDSRTLVLAAHEHDTTIINVDSGNIHTSPKCEFPAEHIVFSPDSTSFIVATFCDEPLQCRETKTGELRWALDPGSMEAEFSPDGKTVIATRKKSVLLCEAKDGRVRHELTGHKSRVDFVKFSPDGRRAASAGQSQVYLWNFKKGAPVKLVQEKRGEINVSRFSMDGRFLAVAGGKGVISIYDTVSGKPHYEWEAHEDDIWQLEFSADGKRLMSRGGESRLWELPACQQIFESPEADWQLSPDHKTVMLLISGTLKIRDLGVGKVISRIQFKIKPKIFAVSPDKNWIAGASDDAVTLWKIKGML